MVYQNYQGEMFEIQFSSRLLDTEACNSHMHSCIEIILVSEGTMHMTLEEQEYWIPAGSAVFVEPYEPHAFTNDLPNKSYIIEFMLESNLVFWEYIQNHTIENRQIVLPAETLAYLKSKLPTNSNRNSGERSDPSFVQAILMPLCYEFMSRCKTAVLRDKIDNTYVSSLKLISRMIWQDPQQDISLAAVAKKLGVHKTTLSKQFSKKTNMTFTESVQYIRVCKAAFLLRQSVTISAAADFAGFHCIRSFNRVFKKVTGCTPTEYIQSRDNSMERYNIAIGFE